jgi:hypothetical protein
MNGDPCLESLRAARLELDETLARLAEVESEFRRLRVFAREKRKWIDQLLGELVTPRPLLDYAAEKAEPPQAPVDQPPEKFLYELVWKNARVAKQRGQVFVHANSLVDALEWCDYQYPNMVKRITLCAPGVVVPAEATEHEVLENPADKAAALHLEYTKGW